MPVFPRIKQDVIDGLSGTKQILDEKGPKGLVEWILEKKYSDQCPQRQLFPGLRILCTILPFHRRY